VLRGGPCSDWAVGDLLPRQITGYFLFCKFSGMPICVNLSLWSKISHLHHGEFVVDEQWLAIHARQLRAPLHRQTIRFAKLGAAIYDSVAMSRVSNNPKRRFIASNQYPAAQLRSLAKSLIYVGSANHKRFPADYNFHPPANPRPWKSMCDLHRQVLRDEAQALLENGVRKAMISEIKDDGFPKYVWSVDEDNNVFEAKIGNGGYHGYQLENDDDMAELIRREWKKR
jgi:hypothetical protein